jgi:Fe-S oxidoreductase
MCPSYMVLRDEKHTTRGRARILFEMLNGDPVAGLWKNEEVFEALDLCLACKGCTSECPVHVDMPIMKAEFLAQRYRRRLRPAHAYAFGRVDLGARLASRTPVAANFVTRKRPLSRLLKSAAGMAPEREFPAFAPLTLKRWVAERDPRLRDGKRVILWADTFTNYFHTDVGVAAVEALEAAGYEVVIPEGHLCCGRPLYDYGMLRLARRYLERVLDRLREDIRAGTPVVGIEPSCLAVFKDELPKLLPHDEDGKRLTAQAFHLGEFLDREGYEPPALARELLLHGHCHQKATGGIKPEVKLLEKMDAHVEQLDSGCCGLAGSWGYERDHYELSMACAERVLLPAVRGANPTTIVVADGFSCRTQIEHGAARKPLHLAQVLRLAQTGTVPGPPQRHRGRGRFLAPVLMAVAGGALLAARRT